MSSKKKKKNLGKLIYSENFKSLICDSHIFLDTNFLIGLLNLDYKNSYEEILNNLQKYSKGIFVIDKCVQELLKGSKGEYIHQEKVKFINNLSSLKINIIHLDISSQDKDFVKLVKSLGFDSKVISLTDIYLMYALCFLSDNENMYLITEDLKDFNNSILNLEGMVGLVKTDQVKNIGLFGLAK